MSATLIRRAARTEADHLTELAMRAKASWGYDAQFMAQCRAELTLTPETVDAWTIWVAERDGRIAGMVALAERGEVEDFMVDPDFQGLGVGRALMDTLIAECRRRGLASIGLDADPNAETIYLKLGFVTVGQCPSKSIPGRLLPRMVRVI